MASDPTVACPIKVPCSTRYAKCLVMASRYIVTLKSKSNWWGADPPTFGYMAEASVIRANMRRDSKVMCI